MRESRIYLTFLKESLPTLFICIFALSILAYIYSLRYPIISQNYTKVVEISHTDQDAPAKELEANNLVSLLRTQTLQQELRLDPSVKMKIYKDSPFLIVISSGSNASHPSLEENVNKLVSFSQAKYSLQLVGGTGFYYRSNNSNLFIIGSVFAGLFLGMLISLIRHYFKHY